MKNGGSRSVRGGQEPPQNGLESSLTERDASLLERIRQLHEEELEEESEEDDEGSWIQCDANQALAGPEKRQSGGGVDTETRRSAEAINELGPAQPAIELSGENKKDVGDYSHASASEVLVAGHAEQGQSTAEIQGAQTDCEENVEGAFGFRLNAESTGLGPDWSGAPPQNQGSDTAFRPGNAEPDDLEDSDFARYDSLYREHLQRQLATSQAAQRRATESLDESVDIADGFEISQPDSESQQQALMTSISEREQQFLASIRQLDQVELEEEEMSETEETDSDEDRSDAPAEDASRVEVFTFDTSLPTMHTYLGEFDDVAGGRAFEEGGSLISLPMFYLDGVVLFPGDSLPLRVLQPRFQGAVRRAMRQTTHACTIGVVLYRGLFHPDGHGIASVGTTAEIRQVKEQDDGTFNIVAKGRQRFYIRRLCVEPDNSPSAQVQIIPEERPLRMPRAAFCPLAAWPSLKSGRVPPALAARPPTQELRDTSPRTYTRSPRRASTGGIPSSSVLRRRDPPDVSPTFAPLRSRRRVSFAGGATDATASRSGLDVFDFSIEEERPNEDSSGALRGGDRTGLNSVRALQGGERPELDSHVVQGGGGSGVWHTPDRKGVSGVCAELTPGVSGGKGSHVATPRSELFLPAYKRRRQRRGKDGNAAVGELLEVEKGGADKHLRAGRQEILWPELCPVRYDLARTISAGVGVTSLREAGLDVCGMSPGLFSKAVPLEEQGPFAGDGIHRSGKGEAFYSSPRALEGGSLGARSGMERSTVEAGTSGREPFSNRGYQYGHGGGDEQFADRSGNHGRWGGDEQQRTSSRQSAGESPRDESREDWQGVAKAWAADDAKWRSRAPLSAWPYWVYRMHDAYVLGRRVADLMRQVVPAKVIDELLNEPEAMSYYVASNLPLQDSSRQELLETNGTVYRLRKEIKILETLDKLKCKACESVVASKTDLMVMSADGPIGAYVNAHGHIHETLTLRRVQGLELEGGPETENSWFPGYAWTIAHCHTCGYHMGWKFTATKPGMTPDSFWGMTRAHLADSTASEHHSEGFQVFSW